MRDPRIVLAQRLTDAEVDLARAQQLHARSVEAVRQSEMAVLRAEGALQGLRAAQAILAEPAEGN